jgi:hypothetical protein
MGQSLAVDARLQLFCFAQANRQNDRKNDKRQQDEAHCHKCKKGTKVGNAPG